METLDMFGGLKFRSVSFFFIELKDWMARAANELFIWERGQEDEEEQE